MTGPRPSEWLVLDMDDGLLRIEPTRTAAVRWLLGWCDAPRVVARHTYGPGRYSYVVGGDDPYDTSGAFIERAAQAIQDHGWDLTRPPRYPHRNEPWTPQDDTTDDDRKPQ